ncbi:MAG: BBP7 family outer membrane beta-barrel protein [Pirellulales bacterium]|nr:BBP7 family outer membrane beta-barrel protein [Pirellulales bacterium]
MRRLPLALASTWMAAMTIVASAQNPYGYAPNAMTPGGTPPGIFPGAAQYHAAIPAPPRPKLPRGVSDDGGLLFYNGRPYQDGSNPYGQQMHAAQMAAYQEAVGGAAGDMTPAQQYAANVGQGYGEGYSGGAPSEGYCNDPYCNNAGHPGYLHSLWAWLHGENRGFPGKMGSCWSAGAELVYYRREHEPDRGLVFNTNNDNTLFSAQQLHYEYEPGFRTWLTYMGPSGIAAQFIYLQTDNMDASNTSRGNNNLQVPFPLAANPDTPSFFGADRMTVSSNTDFHSFEANVIYPWSSLQFLAGFRYVEVSDDASIVGQDTDAAGIGRYNVDCINRLYGGQIGVLGQYEAFGLVNFDFVAKTGIYGNASFQHQMITDNQGFDNPFRDASGTNSDVAYVSELNARAVFPLGPTFSIQAGYDVIFINRLALGTQQFDFNVNSAAGTQVHGGRNLIIHGISGGLTAKW